MAEKNIDFYLIPTADDHSSEYVSDYYKVRNYFAGFTGSAGSLLIGREMAGLWTDGRYYIQAERQLEGSCVSLFRMGSDGVPMITDYLKAHLPEGGTLAFDGQVIDRTQGQDYEKIVTAGFCGIRIWPDSSGKTARNVLALRFLNLKKNIQERAVKKNSQSCAVLWMQRAVTGYCWLLWKTLPG